MTDQNTTVWYNLTPDDVAGQLGVDLDSGLTAAEAQRRLQQYGPNKLAEKKRSRAGLANVVGQRTVQVTGQTAVAGS